MRLDFVIIKRTMLTCVGDENLGILESFGAVYADGFLENEA